MLKTKNRTKKSFMQKWASGKFQSTLQIWLILKKVIWMMWYEILRPSFFLAHFTTFISRWSLLSGGEGVCISLFVKWPLLNLLHIYVKMYMWNRFDKINIHHDNILVWYNNSLYQQYFIFIPTIYKLSSNIYRFTVQIYCQLLSDISLCVDGTSEVKLTYTHNSRVIKNSRNFTREGSFTGFIALFIWIR